MTKLRKTLYSIAIVLPVLIAAPLVTALLGLDTTGGILIGMLFGWPAGTVVGLIWLS